MTYSLATMEISKSAHDEIKAKLIAAGYKHAIEGDTLDMTHIGLIPTDAAAQADDDYDRQWCSQ